MFSGLFDIIDDLAKHGFNINSVTSYFSIWTCLVVGLICVSVYWVTQYILSKIEVKSIAKRTVFITGCDSGFGHLLAKTLDEKGVRVFAGCLTEIGVASISEETSSRLIAILVDVTKEETVTQAFDVVKESVGKEGLWGVVNNAGIMPTFGPAEWTTLDSFKTTCDVNLFGTISVTLQFLPLLRMRGGRLVNVCSVTSNFPYPGLANYTVSKSAIKAFSVCMRRELLSSDVTVHILEPGGYNTSIANQQRLTDAFLASYQHALPGARAFYGGNIAKHLMKGLDVTHKMINYRLHDVTDAMTHALFAKYPRRAYSVGMDANLFFRFMSIVPERVADFIIGWPEPYGELIPEFKASR